MGGLLLALAGAGVPIGCALPAVPSPTTLGPAPTPVATARPGVGRLAFSGTSPEGCGSQPAMPCVVHVAFRHADNVVDSSTWSIGVTTLSMWQGVMPTTLLAGRTLIDVQVNYGTDVSSSVPVPGGTDRLVFPETPGFACSAAVDVAGPSTVNVSLVVQDGCRLMATVLPLPSPR